MTTAINILTKWQLVLNNIISVKVLTSGWPVLKQMFKIISSVYRKPGRQGDWKAGRLHWSRIGPQSRNGVALISHSRAFSLNSTYFSINTSKGGSDSVFAKLYQRCQISNNSVSELVIDRIGWGARCYYWREYEPVETSLEQQGNSRRSEFFVPDCREP